MLTALASHLLQFTLQVGDALTHLASVLFQLGLARSAAHTDVSCLLFELGVHAHQARQLVGQSRQLYLQFPLAGVGALGENAQDELGAVYHARLQDVLEVALLQRRQVIVYNDHIGVDLAYLRKEQFRLAPADEGSGIRAGTSLSVLANYFQTGGVAQGAQLFLDVAVQFRVGVHEDEEGTLAFLHRMQSRREVLRFAQFN
ncbi:hypothetical protein HRbin16_03294 [bacterium HR16]|nr:hypothetical protein HRbin16_03294 [bacterium HR16]